MPKQALNSETLALQRSENVLNLGDHPRGGLSLVGDAGDFDDQVLLRHLSSLYGEEVSHIAIEPLVRSGVAHETMSSVSRLQVEFADGRVEHLVMRMPTQGSYGLEEAEDQARHCLLGYRSFGQTPGHPRAVDVVMVDNAGTIVSLAGGRHFFLLEEFFEGYNYGDADFVAMRSGVTPEREWRRAQGFANYLVDLHRARPDADLKRYQRSLREVVGGGDGLMGVIDSFPPTFVNEHQSRLSRLELGCLSRLQQLRNQPHRLRITHGDFHPWNILFRDDYDFTAIDRSRCLHSDPAIDVGAMLISYLVLAIWQGGPDRPAMRLAQQFIGAYTENSGDHEILEVLPLYTAMRAAAAASPCFYPDMPRRVRTAVFDLGVAVANLPRIDVDLAPIAAILTDLPIEPI